MSEGERRFWRISVRKYDTLSLCSFIELYKLANYSRFWSRYIWACALLRKVFRYFTERPLFLASASSERNFSIFYSTFGLYVDKLSSLAPLCNLMPETFLDFFFAILLVETSQSKNFLVSHSTFSADSYHFWFRP